MGQQLPPSAKAAEEAVEYAARFREWNRSELLRVVHRGNLKASSRRSGLDVYLPVPEAAESPTPAPHPASDHLGPAWARGAPWASRAILCGGEPTRREDLPAVLAWLRHQGFMEVVLRTGVEALGSPGVLEILEPFRDLLLLDVALTGGTDGTGDWNDVDFSGDDATRQSALLEILRLGFRFRLRLVATRRTLRRAPVVVEALTALLQGRPAHLRIEFPSPFPSWPWPDALCGLGEIRQALPGLLGTCRRHGLFATIHAERGLPPCALPGDLRHLEASWIQGPIRPPMLPHGFGAPCAGCAMRPRCPGVSRALLEAVGDADMAPFPAAHGDGDTGPSPSPPPEAAWKARVRRILGDGARSVRLADIVAPEFLPPRACIRPWTRMEYSWRGYAPCDYPDQTVASADLDLATLWNDDRMREFRRAVAAPGHPSTCRPTCPDLLCRSNLPSLFTFFAGPPAFLQHQFQVLEAILDGADIVPGGPLELVIVPTTRCNFRCVMCDRERTVEGIEDPPASFYDGIRPFLETLQKIEITGGEALVSEGFWSFLDTLDRDRLPQLSFSLVTNGSLLTPANQARLERVPLERLIVSINAATPETYLRVNRGLPFAVVRENLDHLARQRALGRVPYDVTYSMVLVRLNVHEIRAFADLARRDGADVRFSLPEGNENGQSILVDPGAMTEAAAALEAVAAEGFPRAREIRAAAGVLRDRLQAGRFEPF
jgi:MoaA/NifB/PqqE/SkfB family radical SAM enzyme